jgi:DNA repair protein RecN (Recombination protein N)
MIEVTAGAFQLVDEDESSALSQLGRAMHLLQPLARQIGELQQISDELQDVLYRLQEVSRTLGNLSESVRLDPARLEQVEDRLVTIERLKKKYGGSIEATLDHLGRIQDEYERLADYEANVEKLQRTAETRYAAFKKAADKLSASRKKAARAFETSIQRELNDLAMERTTVKIEVTSRDDSPSADGLDRVEILIAPNRGEEPKAMQRIASGGELSRIQLAIAAALFKASSRSAAATLIFDEIDAGIGGRVAEVVGRKLQELAARNQVVCVTHLPQIASFGTTHFVVWKEDAGGHTRARVRRLDDAEERVSEIARMLGGEKVTESARTHARELLTLSSS